MPEEKVPIFLKHHEVERVAIAKRAKLISSLEKEIKTIFHQF